jgi:hypothetical protein
MSKASENSTFHATQNKKLHLCNAFHQAKAQTVSGEHNPQN